MQIRKAGGAAGPDRQKRDKAAARRKALKNRDDEEKAKLFQEIMARIRMVTETRTQVELADFLGIRQSSVSDSCRRQAVPPQWYLTLLAKLGVNPRWLETGLGQQYILGPRSGEAEADGAEPQGDGPPERGFCRLVRVHSSRCLPPGPGRVPVLPVLGEMALPCEWLQPSLVLLHLESNAGQPHFPRGRTWGWIRPAFSLCPESITPFFCPPEAWAWFRCASRARAFTRRPRMKGGARARRTAVWNVRPLISWGGRCGSGDRFRAFCR